MQIKQNKKKKTEDLKLYNIFSFNTIAEATLKGMPGLTLEPFAS